MKNRNIWIAVGVVSLLCVCAVVASVLVLREAGSRVSQSVKSDPAEIARMGNDIAEYTVPVGYKHQMAMQFLGYTFITISPDRNSSGMIIMLAQFAQSQQIDQKTLEEQMRQSFEQQSGQRGLNMKVIDVRQVVIRGEEVSVTTSEGTDANSGVSIRQVITVFPGKSGVAIVMIQGVVSAWDDTAVNEFISSIH
jgi:hypothetical protein